MAWEGEQHFKKERSTWTSTININKEESGSAMSSTQDYLKKYMSKPASLEEHKRKKLKKKKSSSTKSTVKRGNFAIHDEDEVSWKNTRSESDSDDSKDTSSVENPT